MADTNYDPFEEFEFKPINEGLGFHGKKTNDKKSSSLGSSSITSNNTHSNSTSGSTPLTKKPNGLLKGEVADSLLDLGLTPVTSKKSSEVSFQSPLPRPEAKKKERIEIPTIQDDSVIKSQNSVNDILKTLNQKRHLDFEQATEKQKVVFKKSKPQLFAAFLDGMLITAAFLLSMIVMLSVTKVDLFMSLTHAESSNSIFVATAALLASVYFIYMVVNRAFAGYTPGEWAYDQVCGTPTQSSEYSYVLKIALRTLIVMATGFILLPIISYLFNRDIAGELAGVSLYQKPNASLS